MLVAVKPNVFRIQHQINSSIHLIIISELIYVVKVNTSVRFCVFAHQDSSKYQLLIYVIKNMKVLKKWVWMYYVSVQELSTTQPW
jgi:hypothetical protein